MDIRKLYEAYSRLTWQQQLGNLASTLARVSHQAELPESDELVKQSLREAAYLLEWSAPEIPSHFELELANMQREILAWHRCWPIDAARPLLALHTRNQSERLLQISGVFAPMYQTNSALETVETVVA